MKLAQLPVDMVVTLDGREVVLYRDCVEDNVGGIESHGSLLRLRPVYLHEGSEVFDEFVYGIAAFIWYGRECVFPLIKSRQCVRFPVLLYLHRLYSLVTETETKD